MSNTPAEVTLEQKIVAALAEAGVNSGDLSPLIERTEAAIAEADQAAETARSKALDPALSPDAKAAREAMVAIEFDRDRLKTVLPKLREKLGAALRAEQHARWYADFKRVEEERDRIAQEFAETYPRLADQLADLFARMQACDRLCAEVNSAALDGEPRRLAKTELKARGLEAFSGSDPEILRDVQLPDFRASGRPLWPPKAPSLAAIYAESMAVPYHPGGNWADPEVQLRRRAEIEAEQQRVAEYHEQAGKAQEERLNREERERFETRAGRR